MRRVFALSFVFLGLLASTPALAADASSPSLKERVALRREERLNGNEAVKRVTRPVAKPAKPTVQPNPRRRTTRPSLRELRERAAAQRSTQAENDHYVRPTRTANDTAEFLAEVLRLVNEEREKEGVGALTRNALLDKAAQDYAVEMRIGNFFSHESPDGTTFDQRIKAAGYPGPCPIPGCRVQLSMGENLAKGFETPAAAMKGWMNSPGHKANILSPHFDEIGLGLSGTYWSQEFGMKTFSNPR